MAHVPENPRMDNVGTRGINPVLRNLSSIFLPQAAQQMDPAALLKHSSYLLPHSKVDMEEFLGTTFVNAMDSIPSWWKTVAGVIDSKDINFQLKIWVQKNVVAQPTAPGAAADISEQTQEIRNFTLHRIQTDFQFKNENFQFGGPDGNIEVEMKLGAVRAAVETAYIRNILESLFYEKDYYRLFKSRYGSRSVSTIEDAVRWTRDVTFFVQKGGIRGMAEVYGRIRDAVRDAGGQEPDVWILPNGFLLTSSIQSFDAVQYKDRGKLVYDHLGRLDESLRQFHGVQMVESPPIKVENEREPIDPLRGILRTGRYFLMGSTVYNLKDYSTFKRDVQVYSHATDNERTRVSLSDAISNVDRWDSDGYLNSDHYTLAANAVKTLAAMGFAVPEDPNDNAQPDMFVYRGEDGAYYVADVFGHMEDWNLDVRTDARRTVETGYNSFDKVLSENDRTALSDGLNMMSDMTSYNPMRPDAQVFREALRLSNLDNINPNTGNVDSNLYGFAQNMPSVEQTDNGRYVMRVAGDGPYITFAGGVLGSSDDIAAAYSQNVPFAPTGMGSIPGMLTLASIARSAEGSAGRLGYSDKLLNTARAFAVAFEKVYDTMVTHWGMKHISLDPDRVPEFWKSGVDRHDSMILFGTQHFDTPKYPFFVPGAVGTAPVISAEDAQIRGDFRTTVNRLRNQDTIDYIRQFLDDDRAYDLFLTKVRELYGQSFADLYNQFIAEERSASKITKLVNQIVTKLQADGVSCVGLTDGEHISLRLVVAREEFLNAAPWDAGLRPRNASCPHGVYEGDRLSFQNDDANRNTVQAGDVQGTYVVDSSIAPYSPEVEAFGPSTGLDLDDIRFDDFGKTRSSDDKQYTGAYSSNLDKKYREIANKYPSQPIHRAYGQMFLLAMNTADQFQRFMDNDVEVPADVLAMNPQVEYEVKAVIPIKGGGATVNIHRFAPNFVLENGGIARNTKASFAEYMLAIVTDTRNYTVIQAGWCSHYIRGGNLDPLTYHNMNVNTGQFGGSTMYMLQPARSRGRPNLKNPVQNVQFFTGRYDETYWDAEVASELGPNVQWGQPTSPSSPYYSLRNGLHEIASKLHITEQTHAPTQEPQINNLIFQTQQYLWDDGAGGFNTKIQNQDVFGPDGVYTGCAKDRDGSIFRCAHAKDNCGV